MENYLNECAGPCYDYVNGSVVALLNLESQDKLDYRLLLKGELEERRRKNPAYSLRAFARTLGVSPAYLSQIFARRRNLSERTALRFAGKLRWNAERRTLFSQLLQYQRAADEEGRAHALENIHDLTQLDFLELREDEFQLVADWSHFAIVELARTRGFCSDPRWIADRLEISTAEAEAAIQRLLRVGLLEIKNGRLCAPKKHYRIQDVPSQAIRAFHKRNIAAAAAALETQDFSQRDFSGSTFAVDRDKIPEVKEIIRSFRDKLNKFCTKSEEPDAVYQLSVQFFRLDKEIK